MATYCHVVIFCTGVSSAAAAAAAGAGGAAFSQGTAVGQLGADFAAGLATTAVAAGAGLAPQLSARAAGATEALVDPEEGMPLDNTYNESSIPTLLQQFADSKAKELPVRAAGQSKGWLVKASNTPPAPSGQPASNSTTPITRRAEESDSNPCWVWKHNEPFPAGSPHGWNSFIHTPPDPTTNLNLRRNPTAAAQPPSFPEFCVSKVKVCVWKPDAYYLAQGVQVLCPHCGNEAKHKGWGKLRRVCGLNNTWFLKSFIYECRCQGM
jgi:hypothetical protein